MEEIFGNIYSWFESLYGLELAEHLWGYNCITEVYDKPIIFNSIGSITLGISVLFVLLYYYLPMYFFNHPRSNRWWNWLIVLIFCGAINLFLGYSWTVNDLLNGNIGDCLMYSRDVNGDIISQLIFRSNTWLFGLSNFFISAGFFIIFSFVFKWGSRNCKHSPIL